MRKGLWYIQLLSNGLEKKHCVCVCVCVYVLEGVDGEREKELTKANEQNGILDKVSSFLWFFCMLELFPNMFIHTSLHKLVEAYFYLSHTVLGC